MRTECLPVGLIPHVTDLYKDFLLSFDKVRQFYPAPPFEQETLRKSAQQLRYPDERRQNVANVLERQNKDWSASASEFADVKANIERLRGGANAIVTGHQVSLFGGPLFSLLKALTIVKLAAQSSAAGTEAVPIFWLATEDHDVAEVSSVTLPQGSELRRLTLEPHGTPEAPVSAIKLDGNIEALVADAVGILGECEVSDLLKESYRPETKFGDAFAKLLTRLFATFGLILLDPSDPELHHIAQPMYLAAAERSEELARDLLARGEELERTGYHTQVKVTSTLLFALHSGARTAVHRASGDGGFQIGDEKLSNQALIARIKAHPEDFSANVLMRPAVQDYLLPTLAYVGGPAEVAYFAQAAVVYQSLLGRVTPIFPRVSATLLEPHIAQKLERYEVSFADVLQGTEHTRRLLGAHSLPQDMSHAFEKAKSDLKAITKRLREPLTKLDGTLVEAAEKAESKMMHQIETLETRAASAELRRNTDIARHAEQLSNALFPEKDLQEREIAAVYFLARHGIQLLDSLHDAVSTECPDHQIIYL